jgi:hypothetical protein
MIIATQATAQNVTVKCKHVYYFCTKKCCPSTTNLFKKTYIFMGFEKALDVITHLSTKAVS